MKKTTKQNPNPAPQSREPFERTISVEGKDRTVIVEPLETGFNVIVPIPGGTSAVYDDNLDAALAEAEKCLVAADREFRLREDPVREAFGRTGEYGGVNYDVTVTKRASGKVEFASADWPEVHHESADEEIGFAEFIGKLSMARELREQAGTVDGERAKIEHGNGAPKQTTFIRLDPVELATKLAEAEDALAAAKDARAPFNTAVTAAEKTRDGLIAQLIAAGNQAQPAREEAAVTA